MNFCRGQILSDGGVTSCVKHGAGEALQRESSPDDGNAASNVAEDDVGAGAELLAFIFAVIDRLLDGLPHRCRTLAISSLC